MVKTKIIATLGPAIDSETVLRKMVLSGLDVVRLNFSHGKEEEHLRRLKLVRLVNKKLRRAVKTMQDLEGPRIRLGDFSKPILLSKRRVFYLAQKAGCGSEKEVHFDYFGSLKGIKKGQFIYIDDGKIVLLVQEVKNSRIKTCVHVGGMLYPRKGVNIPQAKLEFDAITDKDKNDLEFAIKHKLDYIAQSFVRSASDVIALRKLAAPRHPQIKIFAKIENQAGLDNLNKIIDAADAIIVARGDLGICVPIYKVALIQKDIIKRCKLKNKPVVVATQMLDSMTENPLPTRAEVSDVTNAILDGANYLLLSAETAVGKFPAQVIEMMNTIIKFTERYQKCVKTKKC